jgi:hypothetical protein
MALSSRVSAEFGAVGSAWFTAACFTASLATFGGERSRQTKKQGERERRDNNEEAHGRLHEEELAKGTR